MGKRSRYSSKGCGCGIGCGCGCCRAGPIAKLCLLIFNTIFLFSGVGLIIFGIWSKVETNFASLQDLVDYSLNDDTLSNAGFIVVGFGLFLVIVSAFGYQAVGCSGKRHLLALYGFLLFVIFYCGIAAAITYGVLKGKMDCCGSIGPTDNMNVSLKDMDMYVPNTCCVLTNSDPKHPNPKNETACQRDAYKFQFGDLTSSQALQITGCYDKLRSYIESNLGVIIGVGVSVSVLQLLGMSIAIGIMRGIDD